YSPSLIQGGRPERGRPGPLLAELVVASRGSPGALGIPAKLVAAGSHGRSRSSGRGPSGKPRRGKSAFEPAISFVGGSNRGGAFESRLGKTMMGRLVSPSGVTLAPRSTRFTRVTRRYSQCSPDCIIPLASRSIGSPAEATTSPEAFNRATALSSPDLTNSL